MRNENMQQVIDKNLARKMLNHFERGNIVFACHAERDVLQRFIKRISLKGYKINPANLHIIVIRMTQTGTLIESKPCRSCAEMLSCFGFKSVTYSTSSGDLITEKISQMETILSSGDRSILHATNILQNILRNEEKNKRKRKRIN